MLRKMAIGFGVIFIAVGILGFVPGLTRNGHLLGIFHVNAAHNMVHVSTGAIAVVCGMASGHAARMFFRTFGIIYGLVAALGFVAGNQPVLGFLANNLADAWLHTGIAVASLLLGFVFSDASLEEPRAQKV